MEKWDGVSEEPGGTLVDVVRPPKKKQRKRCSLVGLLRCKVQVSGIIMVRNKQGDKTSGAGCFSCQEENLSTRGKWRWLCEAPLLVRFMCLWKQQFLRIKNWITGQVWDWRKANLRAAWFNVCTLGTSRGHGGSSWRTEISWSLLLFLKASWEQKHRAVLPENCPHEEENILSG